MPVMARLRLVKVSRCGLPLDFACGGEDDECSVRDAGMALTKTVVYILSLTESRRSTRRSLGVDTSRGKYSASTAVTP
jgi:hypothetical protein